MTVRIKGVMGVMRFLLMVFTQRMLVRLEVLGGEKTGRVSCQEQGKIQGLSFMLVNGEVEAREGH